MGSAYSDPRACRVLCNLGHVEQISRYPGGQEHSSIFICSLYSLFYKYDRYKIKYVAYVFQEI